MLFKSMIKLLLKSLQNISFNYLMIKLVSKGLHYMSLDKMINTVVEFMLLKSLLNMNCNKMKDNI